MPQKRTNDPVGRSEGLGFQQQRNAFRKDRDFSLLNSKFMPSYDITPFFSHVTPFFAKCNAAICDI